MTIYILKITIMKTKVFLFICLLLGMSVSTTTAQDNRAEQGWWIDGAHRMGIWCECDGEMVDVLVGEVQIHWVFRAFKDGPMLEIDQVRGEITSEVTGEVFKVRRTEKWEVSDDYYCVANYNFIGNMGTVYTGKFHFKYSTYEFFVDHVTCH